MVAFLYRTSHRPSVLWSTALETLIYHNFETVCCWLKDYNSQGKNDCTLIQVIWVQLLYPM